MRQSGFRSYGCRATSTPCKAARSSRAPRFLERPILLDQHRRLATYDAFVDTATASVAEAGSSRRPIALLVADVDQYRRLSDEHGQPYAQAVLRIILDLARANLREGELVSYRGGDEFVALLRSSSAAAQRVAERLCAAVRGHPFPETDRGPAPRVTISIGVAAAPEHGSTYQALHAAADSARVRLKAQGRDGAAVATAAGQQLTQRPLDIDRFAGRAEEFRTLVGHLDEVVTGVLRVVAVVGEAGTGTATLVRRLEPEVRIRGGSLVIGRAREQRVREPYGVWASLIAALNRLPGAPAGPWRELPHFVGALGGRSTPGELRGGSRYRLLDEIAEYIRLMARSRPLVLLLDEMQWADVASWDVLEHLAPQLEDERLLIAMTSRTEAAFSEAAERRHGLARHAAYREISLSRLTRDEAKRWLEGAMHGQEIGRELLAFLYRHTEGNPLFISQLLRTLVEEGALWLADGRWQWTPVSELRLPIGLSALITRRLSRLSSSTQAVLSIAAVVGDDFDVGMVVEAGAGSEAAVLLALSDGLAAGILKSTYDRGGRGYAFVHAQMVEALMQSIPPERLRQTHERVAEAIERREKTRVFAIALHYDAASCAGPAYFHALAAADRAERVYAYSASNGFLNVAGRNSSTPAELAEVRVRLATLAEITGRFDEAEELCDLAIEWFVGKGDTRRALTLRRMRERARRELTRPAKATLETLLELDAEARSLGFVSERIEILMMLSQTHSRLGDLPSAERIARECVDTAEKHGDETLLASALTRLGATLERDDPDQAEQIYHRALELFTALGDTRGQAKCHNNLGNIAAWKNAWSNAYQSYNTTIALSRAGGMPDLWGMAASNLGLSYLRTGDRERARELLGEAVALAAAVKNSEIQLYALYNMGRVELENHAWESAAELFEATASLAQRIGADEVELGSMAGVGFCRLETGRMDLGRQAHDEIADRVKRRPDWFQGREYMEALTILLLIADGGVDAATEGFEVAVRKAENSDPYSAAWLTAVCARALYPGDIYRVRPWIERFASHGGERGYGDITKQLKDLLGR